MKKSKKILWKIIKIIWIITIALFCLVGIAVCSENKKEKFISINFETPQTEAVTAAKSNIQPQEKKLHITPEQEEIIKEHYELYYKLSPSANSGEELDKLSNEISEQMCKKYNMTRKEYDDMWDIYNFGYILED